MKIEIPKKIVDRFMSYVFPEPNTGCYLWGGGKSDNGYGVFNIKIPGLPKIMRAHRFSWVANGKELTPGLELCHSCDNPLCVNPNHLWLGTQLENMRDCKAKNRNPTWIKTHCLNGHEFTPENTYRRVDGYRECRICKRKTNSEYRKMKNNGRNRRPD